MKTHRGLRKVRVLERGIQLAFIGKCSVQVNQVSITETFNVKNMERRNDQETRQKAEGVVPSAGS